MEFRLWRWQRWSALAALPLVLAHVVLQYYVFGPESANFETVSTRARLASLLALDIALLITVTAHAFLGMRSIAMDHARTARQAMRATVAMAVLFALTVLYGLAALAAFL